MSGKRLRSLGLVALRSALGAAAIYSAYEYLPQFFALWETERPLQWWAARATGFAAYVALAASMVFGLLVSSRGLDGAVGRKTVSEYHEQWTLTALLFSVAHTLIILTDGYVDISVVGGLVPGKAAHLTGEVALGTLALWGLIVIVVSSWARTLLSYGLWRVVHAGATAVLLLALAHGFLAGADSRQALVRVLYAATGAGLFGLTVFRLTYEYRRPRAPAPAAFAEKANLAQSD